MEEKILLVLRWAKDKNLLSPENAPKQYLKVLEEVGETTRAILKENKEEVIDGLGDIAVTLIILACQTNVKLSYKTIPIGIWDDINLNERIASLFSGICQCYIDEEHLVNSLSYLGLLCRLLDTTLDHCLDVAYKVIENRKGKTENGIFTKEA